MTILSRSEETWKDVPGYEGIYQASSLGNVRTCEGKVTSNSRYSKRVWKSRFLKGRGDNPKTGKRVSLWKDGKRKDFLVARIIAITFLGFPPDNFTVNHKDGNRLNNNIENLEWLSLADNIRHGFATGLYHAQKPVSIIDDGKTINFRKMADLDCYLKRGNGYTSNRIKKHNTVRDSSGKEYTVTKQP